MNLVENRESDLYVWLAPDDVETAQMAGVRFARALAGAPDTAFMIALSKQQELVRVAILEAGVTTKGAALIARAFETGVKLEWSRLAPLLHQNAMGHA